MCIKWVATATLHTSALCLHGWSQLLYHYLSQISRPMAVNMQSANPMYSRNRAPDQRLHKTVMCSIGAFKKHPIWVWETPLRVLFLAHQNIFLVAGSRLTLLTHPEHTQREPHHMLCHWWTLPEPALMLAPPHSQEAVFPGAQGLWYFYIGQNISFTPYVLGKFYGTSCVIVHIRGFATVNLFCER